jgi:hypothetical protein
VNQQMNIEIKPVNANEIEIEPIFGCLTSHPQLLSGLFVHRGSPANLRTFNWKPDISIHHTNTHESSVLTSELF